MKIYVLFFIIIEHAFLEYRKQCISDRFTWIQGPAGKEGLMYLFEYF